MAFGFRNGSAPTAPFSSTLQGLAAATAFVSKVFMQPKDFIVHAFFMAFMTF
jgi:hypothetical protein